jgi:hypothetical protein
MAIRLVGMRAKTRIIAIVSNNESDNAKSVYMMIKKMDQISYLKS